LLSWMKDDKVKTAINDAGNAVTIRKDGKTVTDKDGEATKADLTLSDLFNGYNDGSGSKQGFTSRIDSFFAKHNLDIDKIPVAAGKGVAEYLKPYYGLYGASPTGFNYYFPYFHTDWKQVGSKWDSLESGNTLQTKTGLIQDMVDTFFGTDGVTQELQSLVNLNPNTLGTYIERPQVYSYNASEGSTVNFTTTLLNTDNVDDVVRNWQLCFLLSYQNLPNKQNKVTLEPPVIYEIEIPGLFYSPYAYISKIRITNRGATRLMELPYLLEPSALQEMGIASAADASKDKTTFKAYQSDRAARKANPNTMFSKQVKGKILSDHQLDKRYVETIIPDAYQIDIQIQSLIPDSQNLFFHSLLGKDTMEAGIYSMHSKDEGSRTVKPMGP